MSLSLLSQQLRQEQYLLESPQSQSEVRVSVEDRLSDFAALKKELGQRAARSEALARIWTVLSISNKELTSFNAAEEFVPFASIKFISHS